MTDINGDIYLDQTPLRLDAAEVSGEYVRLFGETYYCIRHYDQMPPFFMSLVSSADHWLFIASTGGLTAGRRNSDSALFPYETEDKITAHGDESGSKTIVRVSRNGRTYLWEPFSSRYDGIYRCERHLYKNIYGNKLIFEEVNHDLALTLRTVWRTGNRFGFVKSCWLQNDGEGTCQITLLDGLLNLLPYGATEALQTTMSSLLHAYKRNELELGTGLGIFSLSATLSDRPQPSESLRATVAWQTGLEVESYLLSTEQVDAFRQGRRLSQEQDICGKAGAYLVQATFALSPAQDRHWHILADVNQDGADVVGLIGLLHQEEAALNRQIEADIAQGTADLARYVAAADGLQVSAEQSTSAHHFANVLFNIMRGGIFIRGHEIERDDLVDSVRERNRAVLEAHAAWFAALPARLEIRELYRLADQSGVPDLIRLCYEYLPLTFSRRHGDPSRPWNRFSINLKRPDGSRRLDYQGNWRDIFQNWEPLLLSFPGYVEGVIAKFLNATTVDGYNPYRVTRAGIEWEIPEPENPWANIGYWSDHQIIYLQKLLEIAEEVDPGSLHYLLNRPIFTYADVPYRLHPYQEMLTDWSHTIDFDWEKQHEVETAVAALGTDGRLCRNDAGDVFHATMMEKLLVLLLAKLTNLVPEGGIWMNTQRPEWNDANNALVGKGLSVVTTAYLLRFITFWQGQLADSAPDPYAVNKAVANLFTEVKAIFNQYHPHLETGFGNSARRAMMDDLGTAVTAYRALVYRGGLPGEVTGLSRGEIAEFLTLAQNYIEQTLRANVRPDGLCHSYNILRISEQGTAVDNLYLMLEGQVAILSSGLLSLRESLGLLEALRHSDLYCPERHSYMLYPNRPLPGFRQKNNVSADQVAGSALIAAMMTAGDPRLLVRDERGGYHFSGDFHNAGDVAQMLDELSREPVYRNLVREERDFVLALFEEIFNHRAFTGRSGTFFAYEGLGSIYWHMVSKLLLATQETYLHAVATRAETAVTAALAAAYEDIRAGLGYHKTPAAYGAFPTDPYSHTPLGEGARQPGMTGQVKEEILTRWGELGVSLSAGSLHFAPGLLQPEEFLQEPAVFSYLNVVGEEQELPLPSGSLAFTFCQTPVIYERGTTPEIVVTWAGGGSDTVSGSVLSESVSRQILERGGAVRSVRVTVAI